ncbi:hypothetical protein CHL67_08370 [Prosthecochloris sp. GSB1]|uniref:hypothetical protein n=1 Tax=Prosthecochloris sp. GSB1 TaxID=281093 RepID=UPI000B8CED23|nr:hypothetical protein [Prosthecochloris sp. GSB1]ASQ90930.1 hypothetical protein CHL67_08370 [Prosthecochloris sp. GSB1]
MNTLDLIKDIDGMDCRIVEIVPENTTVLWGVAPTGDIHLGYAPYILLLRKLKALGCKIIPLIANYHAYLDSSKTSWSDIDQRTIHYQETFHAAGLDHILESKDVYHSPSYIEALFRISGLLRVDDTVAAGDTILASHSDNISIADLIYVSTQILDIDFFDVDIVVCGIDESPIYKYGLPVLQNAPYHRDCSYIYVPMCPGVLKKEMHSSDSIDNKILLSDGLDTIMDKLTHHKSLFSNSFPLADYYKQVLFPLSEQAIVSRYQVSDMLSTKEVARGIECIINEIMGNTP